MPAPSAAMLAAFRSGQPAGASAPALAQAAPAPTQVPIDPARLWGAQSSLSLAAPPIFRASDLTFRDTTNAPQTWVNETESTPGHYESAYGTGDQYSGWDIKNAAGIRSDVYDFVDPRGTIATSSPLGSWSSPVPTTDSPGGGGVFTPDTAAEAERLKQVQALGAAAPDSFAFGTKSGGQHGDYWMYQKQGDYYVPTKDLGFYGGAGSAMDSNEYQRSTNKGLLNLALMAATYGTSDALGAGATAAEAGASTASTVASAINTALKAYQAGQGGLNAYNAIKRGDVFGAVAGGAGALGGVAGLGALGQYGQTIGQGARLVGGGAGLASGIINKNLLAAAGSGLNLAGATGAFDPSTTQALGALQQLTAFANKGRTALRAPPPRTINVRRPPPPPIRPGG